MTLRDLIYYLQPGCGVMIHYQGETHYYRASCIIPESLYDANIHNIGGTENEHGECVWLELV